VSVSTWKRTEKKVTDRQELSPDPRDTLLWGGTVGGGGGGLRVCLQLGRGKETCRIGY